MKKGLQLYRIEIDSSGRIACYCKSKKSDNEIMIPLTRSQRQLFKNYTSSSFIDDVIEEFGNPDVFHPNFTIVKNGNIVYGAE